MNDKITTNSLFFVTFLLLLIFKLSGLITISWVWVFSPLWLPFAFFAGLIWFTFIGCIGIVIFLTPFYYFKHKFK